VKRSAISRRYAKALLLIGKEDGQTETYRTQLGGIAALMEKEDALRQAVCNPLYDAASRKRVLTAVIEQLKLSPVVSSFLQLLLDKGRIGFLTDIGDQYQKYADELAGVARASVVSASPLSQDIVDNIKNALSKKTGKDVLLKMEEDPGLIGGIVTKIGDLVFDGSIKTQLLNMRESLKRGEGA
jgi:F-type H+-transporting ATPase subunit delta